MADVAEARSVNVQAAADTSCDSEVTDDESSVSQIKIHEEEQTSSTLGAAFNIFCTVVGTGVLQQPYGAAQTGWVGAGMLAFMGVVACYTAVILVRCFDLVKRVQIRKEGEQTRPPGNCIEGEASTSCSDDGNAGKTAMISRPAWTYGDIGEAAFGPRGRWFIESQQHLTLVMVATIYNLLGGLNLINILPDSWEWLTEEVAIAIMSVVLWFHVFLKSMGEVAIVSAVNTIVTLLLVVVVIVEALKHPPAEPATTVAVRWDAMRLGAGFSTFTFAYGVHPVIPSVYATMRKPHEYEPMIKATFFTVLSVTLPMLAVGYAIYGEAVQSPIYNTPPLNNCTLLKVIIVLITAHVVGAYAIVLNPTERAFEEALGIDRHRRTELPRRMALRTMFVLFTYGVAVLLRNNFPPLLDLVSAITSAPTMFICPCVFYMRLAYKAGKPLAKREIVWIGFIIALASLGSIFGVVGAVKEIAASF
eukprot:CAMPEP_0198500726 /NCGR_PEP_ID=MMETSP1462-20131121/8308_1 /TAXON_ID=1333877 /ORGANISM="Brandtodinium nutriculum, Strain RCC3387" /LENGTH=474 /DNA_ID=CAMNT_0044229741 /DNA_START=63 /DNA_END=1487 /DNA_ORIENTATION=-